MPDVTATIDSIGVIKSGTSKRGDWTLWKVKTDDGMELTTLNGAQTRLLEDIQERGGAARITYEVEQRDNFTNYKIKNVEGPVDAPEPQETNGAKPAKAEPVGGWDGKDQRSYRCGLWKSYLEGRVPGFFAAMKTWPQEPDPIKAGAFVYETGAALIDQIEAHIYKGFTPEPQRNLREEDIPF